MSAPANISYQAEIGRKAIHILALVVPGFMFFVDRGTCLTFFLPVAAFALALELLRTRSKTVSVFISKYFGRWMRPEEATTEPARLKLNGATWIMLSATLLALIVVIPLPYAGASLAMFMLGDAAAALIGRRWGRTPLWPGEKTLEGTLAFFVVGSIFMAFLIHPVIPWPLGILAAATAALLEWLPLPLNDNIRVPVLVAGLITILQDGPIVG